MPLSAPTKRTERRPNPTGAGDRPEPSPNLPPSPGLGGNSCRTRVETGRPGTTDWWSRPLEDRKAYMHFNGYKGRPTGAGKGIDHPSRPAPEAFAPRSEKPATNRCGGDHRSARNPRTGTKENDS